MEKKIFYPIVEIFHSIQGEGAWVGVNAFFIRLGGCDVHCPWCDQKESWSKSGYPLYSSAQLRKEAKTANPAIIVITGGEPLLHNLDPLTEELRDLGIPLHLETSGAHLFSGKFHWVTFSPKKFKPPHFSVYDHVQELKVVVANDSDLKWAEEQAAKVPPETVKYLQPEWNTDTSQELILQYILHHPEWRISLQTHKFLKVR